MDIIITNKDYFNMLDNQIRREMMKYDEEVMLPKARKLLSDSNIKEEEITVQQPEGYYYKTRGLRDYFSIVRNIQNMERIYKRINTNTDEFKDIKRVTENKLFGTEVSDLNDSPLHRMKDIMTITMNDKEIFPDGMHHPWTIERVLNNLEKKATGNPNLVELAYLTGETECLVAGCETNILYREHAICSGCSVESFIEPTIQWRVDKEVEALGEELVNRYREVIGAFLIVPTVYNYPQLDQDMETPRVARIGLQEDTQEHYYWILGSDRNVTDLYSRDMITTESYKKEAFLQYEKQSKSVAQV